MPRPTRYDVDVLLADGSVATIRTPRRQDATSIEALHERASDDSLYSRFFNLNRPMAIRYVAQLCADDVRLCNSLVAESSGRVIGLATSDLVEPGAAEVSFLVDDAARGRGVGSLLLEHLAAIQRHSGVERLVAEVLAGNRPMLAVFADAGFTLDRSTESGTVHLEMSTAATDRAMQIADERERSAEARSLQAVLAPRVVAVVGAGRDRGGVGREVLENIREGGFTGRLVAVHPTLPSVGDVEAFRTIGQVPERVDLAVVAVPADKVAGVVMDAAAAGTRAGVILTAGLGEAGPEGLAVQQDIARSARLGGMRLVGPNCLGVLSNYPDRLNATFATVSPAAGNLAIGSQSGGVGIAVLDAANRSGLGAAYFVSLGNKADVSGNDLIAAWTDDPQVLVAALYLESFGNPAKFARLARHFSERKPLLAVIGGSSASGRRAGASHTAAAAAPTTGVKALFDQAGVIAVTEIPELIETARLLASQPLPQGGRLGICGNAGGIGVLAADSAQRNGLLVPELSTPLTAELRAMGEGMGGCTNPVDLGAAASPEAFGRAIRLMLSSGEIDSLLVVIAATRVGDHTRTLAATATATALLPSKPVMLVALGLPNPPAMVAGSQIPVFASADAATRALGHATRYTAWRNSPRGAQFTMQRSEVDGARAVVSSNLALHPQGCWLPVDQVGALLHHYGVALVPGLIARSADEAVSHAEVTGFPVVAKAASPGIVHKTEQGLVAADLRDAEAVRTAVSRFHRTLADTSTPVLIQRQVPRGVELVVGAFRDPVFGPLVMVGAGGVETEVWADRTFLLPPVTDLDAARALRSLRIWPLLEGHRGTPPADHGAVERIVQAVARMMQDVPEVCEIDLNPVTAHPEGASCVDVKVRVEPAVHPVDRAAAPSLSSVTPADG